jgi:single-stranded-DNA-specific exonuclease
MQSRPASSSDPSMTRRSSQGRLPDQRWRIAKPQPERAAEIAQALDLSPLLAQVLVNRGIHSAAAAEQFVNPESLQLPSPLEEFPDLAVALELLLEAIAQGHKIAICGDYDADGMTSTALLLRSLRYLGAQVDFAIPSRMSEGYGINRRIVDDFCQEGVRLILTVDNGIAAYDPIAYARERGLVVIVTDHHDLPPNLPPAHAILNPKLLDIASPYSGVAGVGVAYILAVCLAQALQQTRDLTAPLLELFTLGTIADLAPLTGVNRRWVRRGLSLLPRSRIVGVQALIQVAGLGNEDQALKPEAIGFRLGPRINAVGRIAEPQVVIELLTTDDSARAFELAMICEQINQHRQRLCELIEQEAIAWCEATQPDLLNDRVLALVQPGWHHGVIGIVASRLVERYGVPVFIATYEGDGATHIRGSARGIPEFDVFKALQFAETVLEKYGGHRAAGGFSLKAADWDEFRFRLSLSANQQLMPQHLKPLVTVDVQAQFQALSLQLCDQIDRLHPCGIENPDPVFWSENVRIVEQRVIGKNRDHLKLTLSQASDHHDAIAFKSIAWRWGDYHPLPSPVDVAYRLKINEWNNTRNLELEVVGMRPHGAILPEAAPLEHPIDDDRFQMLSPQRVEFIYSDRPYLCSISITPTSRELRIQNAHGQVLALQPQQRRGLLGRSRQDAVEIDVAHPFYFHLIRAALDALQQAAPLPESAAPGEEDAVTLTSTVVVPDPMVDSTPIPDRMDPPPGRPAAPLRVSAPAPTPGLPDSEDLTRGPAADPSARAFQRGEDGVAAPADAIEPDRGPAVDAAVDEIQIIYHPEADLALEATDEAELDELEDDPDFDGHDALLDLETLADEMSGPAIADLFLSAMQAPVDEEPPQDLSKIPGLMTAKQLQTQKMAQAPLPRPEAHDPEEHPAIALASAAAAPYPAPPEVICPPLPLDLGDDGVSDGVLRLQDLRTIQPLSAVRMRQWLEERLGSDRWAALSEKVKTDLTAAYRAYQQQAATDSSPTADYAEAGDRLRQMVDREWIKPMVTGLKDALTRQNHPLELAGVRLSARTKPNAQAIMPLVLTQWRGWSAEALADPTPSLPDTVHQGSLFSPSEHDLIQTFLATWDHALAPRLHDPDDREAIAQVVQLCSTPVFYAWHIDQIHHRLLGTPASLL